MIKKDQHVISSNGSWAVRRTGAETNRDESIVCDSRGEAS